MNEQYGQNIIGHRSAAVTQIFYFTILFRVSKDLVPFEDLDHFQVVHKITKKERFVFMTAIRLRDGSSSF